MTLTISNCSSFQEFKHSVLAHSVIKHAIELEGGYVNNPSDPGGETKYGISKKSYPNLDIKNLTLEDAVEIYKQDWWSPNAALLNAVSTIEINTRISSTSDKTFSLTCTNLADLMFSTIILMGTSRALKLLQQTLNSVFYCTFPVVEFEYIDDVKYPSKTYSSRLVVDGKFGAHTYTVIKYLASRIPPLHLACISQFQMLVIQHFCDLVQKNSKLSTFFKGWINRITNHTTLSITNIPSQFIKEI